MEDEVQAEQSAAKIHELLKAAVKLLGQPLAEAELEKDKKTPDEHRGKTLHGLAFQEFQAQQRGQGQGKGEQFRHGQEPEGGGQPREAREKRFAKLVLKPRWHSFHQFSKAGKTPDA